MRRLSFIAVLVLCNVLVAQSPHGSNFKIACENCHSADGWKVEVEKIKFDHNKTDFILEGQHTAINCTSCHTTLVFDKAENNCFECHTDVHQNSLGKDCESCHAPTSWLVGNIGGLHELQRFPLIGAHLTADCQDCHTSSSQLFFDPISANCIDCHRADFESTTSPNHVSANYSTNCEECHRIDAVEWSSNSISHDFFPLVQAHGLLDCFACHSQNSYAGLSQECSSCHISDYQSTSRLNHAQLSLPTECSNCHTLNPGWQPAQFPIHDNFYTLTGAHVSIAGECSSCHTGSYSDATQECIGCHQPDYNATRNPQHLAAGFSSDCTECHTTAAWTPATFDHDSQFFPIYSGKHRGEWDNCTECHTTASNYSVFSCINCHEHNQTDMNSKHSGINGYSYTSTACLSCHPTGSEGDSFNHSLTNFPLIGAHIANDCADCHTAGYTGTSTECVSCHQTNFNQTANPNHQALNLSSNCDECHTNEPGWEPAQFSIHSEYYMLSGAHVALSPSCNDCHEGNYVTTKNQCNDCHIDNYNAASNPNHQTLLLSTDCEECHTTEAGWQPAQFIVHNEYYMLTGAHVTLSPSCNDCHEGNYISAKNQCVDCHLTNFNAAVNPNHQSLLITNDCEVCHTTQQGWEPALFPDHDQIFPLSGAHEAISQDCNECHQGNYSQNSALCYDCHVDDYNSSQSPNHATLNFPTGCIDCHTAQPGWTPALFPIHNEYYELLGAHALISNDCLQCHNETYTNNRSTCYECHSEEYVNTIDPKHDQVYPTTCDDCHSQTAWTPAAINHDQFYVLLGAHALIANDCTTCHETSYTDTPNTCIGCHEQSYKGVTDPKHDPNFPTTCEDCHSQTAWTPATFDHNLFYPLLGAHANISNNCADCHDATFTNTPTLCYGCHENNYKNVTDPKHDPDFPTTCEDCHSQTAWTPATFDHNLFYPLLGAHANISNNCADCHDATYTNTPTLCYGCHENNYTGVIDPKHDPNFPTTCEDCHSQTAWIPASFNHDLFYVLVGAHASIADNCSSCHETSYTNTPNNCFGCHETDYRNVNDPKHDPTFPVTCDDCHTQNSWKPATFEHDSNYFPIYSGKHRGEWDACSDCHNVSSNYSVFTCIDCHEHDNKNEVDSDHREVNGYIYTATSCFTCHPNGTED
ncbi:MAG: hypothetical protein KKA84_11105 [Bacteroidetes bacterium]|nr:hypothetical protein [Bacteroidota bacterium]